MTTHVCHRTEHLWRDSRRPAQWRAGPEGSLSTGTTLQVNTRLLTLVPRVVLLKDLIAKLTSAWQSHVQSCKCMGWDFRLYSYYAYRMAGNFRGVLIFVIFVVNLAVTKFFHPRKLMPTVICESMMMGVATNIVAARPTLPRFNKQQ